MSAPHVHPCSRSHSITHSKQIHQSKHPTTPHAAVSVPHPPVPSKQPSIHPTTNQSPIHSKNQARKQAITCCRERAASSRAAATSRSSRSCSAARSAASRSICACFVNSISLASRTWASSDATSCDNRLQASTKRRVDDVTDDNQHGVCSKSSVCTI